MAETAEVTRLRMKLGESIPQGGSATDTMFSETQLVALLDANATFDGAVLEGWQAKQAALANLVNVTDGAASRELSDLFDHATEMVGDWDKKINGRSGRTRVGRIVRS